MYNIPYFKEPDSQVVRQFMQQHPFAMLIGSRENIPVATQVPLLIEDREGKFFLKGHIMRDTDHHIALDANKNVLCVFTGAHTYVSASWYATKQTASTWNYMSVHASGTLNFLPEANLIDILRDTTTLFEKNPHSPAAFEALPNAYVQRLMKAIIAFEIEVTRIDHVFKLSQNRDSKSYTNIMEHLKTGNEDAQILAAEMQQRQASLFETE